MPTYPGREMRFLDQVARLDKRFLVVSGELGVGKSRLLRELRYSLQLEDHEVYLAHCFGSNEGLYQPFVSLLAQILSGGRERGPVLSKALKRFGPEIAKLWPELTSSHGIKPTARLSPEQEKLRLYYSLSQFVIEIASATPLVLVIEDLHLASEEDWELLEYLARNVYLAALEPDRQVRLFWCGSLRDDFRLPPTASRLLREGMLQELKLLPLRFHDIRDLLGSMLGSPAFPAPLLESLFEESKGNPFFVEEMMKAMIDDGHIFYERGRWHFSESSVKVLPGTLEEILSRRLAALGEDSRRLLQVLAVVNRPAGHDLLLALSGLPREKLYPLLDDLEQRQLLKAERRRGYECAFSHSKMREIFYQGMDPAAKKKLHLAAGKYLKKIPGARLEEHGEEVLFHLLQGEAREEAAPLLSGTLARLKSLFAHIRLQGLAEAALAVYRPPPATFRPLLREIWNHLAEVYRTTGELEKSVAALQTLLQEFGGELPEASRAELLLALAEIRFLQGDFEEAMAAYSRGLAECRSEGSGRAQAAILIGMSNIHLRRGDLGGATRHCEESLALLQRHPPGREMARAYSCLAQIYYKMSDYARSISYLGRVLKIIKQQGLQEERGHARNNLGLIYRGLGDYREAEKHGRKALELFNRIGHYPHIAISSANLGVTLTALGRFREALECFDRSQRSFRELGDDYGYIKTLWGKADVLRILGDWGAALACLEEALPKADRVDRLLVQLLLARIYGEVGKEDDALLLLDEAGRGARELEQVPVVALALLLRGEFLAWHEDDETAAEAAFAEASAIFERAKDREGGLRVLAARGRLAVRKNRREDVAGLVKELSGQIRGDWPARDLQYEILLFLGEAAILRREEKLDDLVAPLQKAIELKAEETIWSIPVARALGAATYLSDKWQQSGRCYQKAIARIRQVWESLPAPLREGFLEHPARKLLKKEVKVLRRRVAMYRGVRKGDDVMPAEASPKVSGLHREVAIRHRLLDIDKAVNSIRDQARLLELILTTGMELAGASRGLILMSGEEGWKSVARYLEKQAPPEGLEESARQLAEEVARKSRAVIANDLVSESKPGRDGAGPGAPLLAAWAAYPLRFREEMIGVLYLDRLANQGSFPEEAGQLLGVFSEQAGLALQNSRLHQDLQSSRKKIEAMNRSLHESRRQLEDQVATKMLQVEEVRDLLSRQQSELEGRNCYGGLIGASKVMQELYTLLDRIKDKDLPVLIEGESGTGKELVAQAIHFQGPRRKHVFGAENFAAIAENLIESELFGYVKGAFTGADQDRPGLFEAANGGTLFLDEIGDMGAEMQKKLLRVLQEGEIRRVGGKDTIRVDVRIIAATNKPLRQMVEQGAFREDLYFRFNVVNVRLLPLRERSEDIPLLLDHFLAQIAATEGKDPKRLSPGALELVLRHPWPGNVRELKNFSERLTLFSRGAMIQASEVMKLLPQPESGGVSGWASLAGKTYKEAKEVVLDLFDRKMVEQALVQNGGTVSLAAEDIGVDRRYFHKMMKKYELKSGAFKERFKCRKN